MTEHDLIDLGFELQEETIESSDSETDWCYYTYDIAGVSLFTNSSDEWDHYGILVNMLETDVEFRDFNNLEDFIKLIELNQR